MAGSGIHDEVDTRQRETVLWACFVDVSEVDAESPLVVCFFNNYDVGQPFRIFHFFDCSSLEEFADLLVDAFCLSGSKLLLFCLTGLKDGMTFSL